MRIGIVPVCDGPSRAKRIGARCLARHMASLAIVLLAIAGNGTALDIPVFCDGMRVGTITVDVDGTGQGVEGRFTAFPPLTYADALEKCGEDHFNWYQAVIQDNMPPVDAAANRLMPPYIDPPRGGYGNDPGTAGDDTQWADGFPWYWDEGADPPAGTDGFSDGLNVDDNTDANGLDFSDFPGGAAGTELKFKTYLVSVNDDGSFHSLHGGFSWSWSTTGGASDVSPLQGGPLTVQRLGPSPKEVSPGEELVVQFRITNTSDANQMFDPEKNDIVETAEPGWIRGIEEPEAVELEPGETVTKTVRVEVPEAAQPGDMDVIIDSYGDPSTDSATLVVAGPQSYRWSFGGTAEGGQVSATISGCPITLQTTSGQSAADVAAAFADAINGDDCLTDQGISATTSDSTLNINGPVVEVSQTIITDKGLEHSESIPLLSDAGYLLLAVLLLLAGIVHRRLTAR